MFSVYIFHMFLCLSSPALHQKEQQPLDLHMFSSSERPLSLFYPGCSLSPAQSYQGEVICCKLVSCLLDVHYYFCFGIIKGRITRGCVCLHFCGKKNQKDPEVAVVSSGRSSLVKSRNTLHTNAVYRESGLHYSSCGASTQRLGQFQQHNDRKTQTEIHEQEKQHTHTHAHK